MTHLAIYCATTLPTIALAFTLAGLVADTLAESDVIALPIYWEGEAAKRIIDGDLVLYRWQFIETPGPHTMPQPEGVH